MIDFPSEIHFTISDKEYCEAGYEESYHKVLWDFFTTYIIETRMILIINPTLARVNLYVIDCTSKYYSSRNPDEIVEECNAAPLELAQLMFPGWNFNKVTYGF
jgi:hypothetical protein